MSSSNSSADVSSGVSRWVIVADDLTGSADAAVAFAATRETAVLVDCSVDWPDAAVLAVNTESRYLKASDAAALTAAVAERALQIPGTRVVKKIDSLLRGSVGAEVAAVLAAVRGSGRHAIAVVAPAFPATGRTTIGGIVHVHGSPLEPEERGNIAAALHEGGLRSVLVPRGSCADSRALADRLIAIQDAGTDAGADAVVDAAIIDASSDADLALIVGACELLPDRTVLVGSGGVTAQLARLTAAAPPSAARLSASPLSASPLSASPPSTPLPPIAPDAARQDSARHDAGSAPRAGDEPEARNPATQRSLRAHQAHDLVLIGSYSASSGPQLAALIRAGARHLHLDHAALMDDAASSLESLIADVRAGLRSGPAVLTPDPSEPVDAGRAGQIATALGAVAAAALPDAAALIVSGGETARSVLDRLGVSELRIRGELQPGVVLSDMPGFQQPLITKAGAFGNEHTLANLLGHAARTHAETRSASPSTSTERAE